MSWITTGEIVPFLQQSVVRPPTLEIPRPVELPLTSAWLEIQP